MIVFFAVSPTRRSLLRALSFAAFASLAAILPAFAHEVYTSNFTIIHPWADPSEPGQTEAPVYFSIQGIRAADRLIKAYSPQIAESVEMRKGSDRKAPPLLEIGVPLVEKIEYFADQNHLLLKGLKVPLVYTKSYPMTLVFEKAGLVNITLSVGPH